MTRKDYVSMAACVASERAKAGRPGWETPEAAKAWGLACDAVALNMADAMCRDNPRFDRERFLKACREGC